MGILTVSLKPPLSSSLLHSNPFLVFVSSPRWNSSRGGGRVSGNGGGLRVVAYMERNPNSAASIASKLIGALPVVGLIARIFSDEGGVGDDIVDFAEFRRRVGKKCGITDSQAFYEFKDRRGRAGDPLYVLLCCWLAAVGAGLLKSEEILEGVARLRISNDIEFEEETFLALMTSAKEKRAKSKAQTPDIPMEIRVEKALEAIFVCCFGQDPVEEEDVKLLCIMLNGVFPSVGRSNIDSIVSSMAKKLSAGERSYTGQKTLSKEAAQRQMKDLEFLRQNREN
ncbi:photosystem I assembly factor PSA3, chloroplastic [Typha latifolia]|uniref:photosystem I assembly factor PSA3, chloroplastic n=1 Tax=Typha latifolia TaxID=4733 RepID=UPI003C2FF3E1